MFKLALHLCAVVFVLGGEKVKKSFFVLLSFVFLIQNAPVKAMGIIRFVPTAYIYSDINFPLDVAKAGSSRNYNQNELLSVSHKTINKLQVTKTENEQYIIGSAEKTLKSGTSSRTNILGLVEIGNAGIYKAIKNGNIKKIHFVEYNIEKVYIPLVFIPIYFNTYVTTVYGE